jgi:hypothetical protein
MNKSKMMKLQKSGRIIQISFVKKMLLQDGKRKIAYNDWGVTDVSVRDLQPTPELIERISEETEFFADFSIS